MVIISISVPEWVEKEVIGTAKNKSSRVMELIIKGHLAEKLGSATTKELELLKISPLFLTKSFKSLSKAKT